MIFNKKIQHLEINLEICTKKCRNLKKYSYLDKKKRRNFRQKIQNLEQ